MPSTSSPLIHWVFLLPRTRAIQVPSLLPEEKGFLLLLPAALTPPVVRGEAKTGDDAPDLLDVLLALDVLFDGDSLLDVFFRNAIGGLAVAEGLVTRPDVVEGLDVRPVMMPDSSVAGAASETSEKRKPGVLMSCFETRVVRELPLEILRWLAVGTVSARGLALSNGRESFLRMIFTDCDGLSSSVSESNAEISSGRS